MAERAKKTEHSGAKHGNGAYWGRKVEAKDESNRVRREDDKRSFEEDLENMLGGRYKIDIEWQGRDDD